MCGRSLAGGALILTLGISFAPTSTANGSATATSAPRRTNRLMSSLLSAPYTAGPSEVPSADATADLERIMLRQAPLQTEHEAVVQPDQRVALDADRIPAEAPDPVDPDEHMPPALNPEALVAPDPNQLDVGLERHDLLQQRRVLAAELEQEQPLAAPAKRDRRDRALEHVDALGPHVRRQREPEPEPLLGAGAPERKAEVAGGLRPGGGEHLDPLDGRAAEVEEAQQRGTRRRNGERDRKRHHEHGKR